ncbi:hypothetical protein EC968_002299 [Mortierella alpina]|nr:hypothetical protein EC968_002299 [Mortierella alpina]
MPKTVTNSKRRALARRLQKKPRKLDKIFDCINCSQSKTVRCKLKFEERVGSLECEKCKVTYSTSIHHLSHDVDVYHAWIDASEGQATYLHSTMTSQGPQAQGTQQRQKQQDKQTQQGWQKQQEHCTSSTSTSRQYQHKNVEYSPPYKERDIPYSTRYRQWEEEEEEMADPQHGAYQDNQRIHDYWNQGLGTRRKGAGARRG